MSRKSMNLLSARKSSRRGTVRSTLRPVIELLEQRLAPANVDVLTWHNDNFLSGANVKEEILTPANVNSTSFGRLFTYPTDGYVYAQPLYKSNLALPDGNTYNVVFAATEHDSIYAFNADINAGGPNNDGLLWKRSFIDMANGITPVPSGETGSGDIVPEIGITGTPVIDPSTNTLYVVAKTKERRNNVTHYVQKLYAINITTGNNNLDPFVIGDTTNDSNNDTTISVPGTGIGSINGVVKFNALRENNRPSLNIAGNTVYVVWASHGDNGPYHGWVVGFDKTSLQPVAVYNTTPNGQWGGIWQSGAGMATDDQGNLYFSTGNGSFTGSAGARSVGIVGPGLGYKSIFNSAAIKFDFATQNQSSTGLYVNGQFPGTPQIPMGNVNLKTAGHNFQVDLSYDGTTLTETITDLTDMTKTFTTSYAVNLSSLVGGNTAYVGFTGGSSSGGGNTAIQDIQTWKFGNVIDHSGGFTNHSDLSANGAARYSGSAARLTDGSGGEQGEAGSIFSNSQVDITSFTTSFTFKLTSPGANGLTFTIQNNAGGTEFSNSVLKLATNGGLSVADFFTPFNEDPLDRADADLGSGGTMLLPDSVGSPEHPHLMVETGKEGKIYLIDRADLGQYRRTGDNSDDVVDFTPQNIGGVWASPAFFNGRVYYHGSGDVMKAFGVVNGKFMPRTPVDRTTNSWAFPGSQPSISANGTSDAIAWELQTDNFAGPGPAILHAYEAMNLSHELYRSDREVVGSAQSAWLRDQPGPATKFTVPTVTNGHVYAGTGNSVSVFGLFDPAANVPAAPSGLVAQTQPPAGRTVKLTWTNNATNATGVRIFRSTDGINFTRRNTVARFETTYTETNLAAATLYYYRVVATNQVGDGDASNTADVATPGSPVLTLAHVCSTEVDLSWTRAGNDHFDVERSTDGTNFTVINQAPIDTRVTTYSDTGLAPGTYFYRVRAFNVNPNRSDVSIVMNAQLVTDTIDHSSGFDQHSDLTANGSMLFTQGSPSFAELTDGNFSEAGTVFSNTTFGTGKFHTTFTFRIHDGTDPRASGFTFIIQADPRGPAALGSAGGGLGYGPPQAGQEHGIRNSLAIKFDIFDNEGEGGNSTGLFTDGRAPTVRESGLPDDVPDKSVDLTGTGIELNNQSTKLVELTYDGTTLTESITDLAGGNPYTINYTVNIPAIIGSDTAYVGFGGSTEDQFSTLQDIRTWKFEAPFTLPAEPSNLNATVAAGQVMLAWMCNSNNEDGFKIQRSDGGDYVLVGTTGRGVTTYTDTPPQAGTYYYRVYAFNLAGDSEYSNIILVDVLPPAPPPGGGRGGNGKTPPAGVINDAALIFNPFSTPGSFSLNTNVPVATSPAEKTGTDSTRTVAVGANTGESTVLIRDVAKGRLTGAQRSTQIQALDQIFAGDPFAAF